MVGQQPHQLMTNIKSSIEWQCNHGAKGLGPKPRYLN